ncbi:MAG: tetratricopeptide repeat protein [Candidatus Rokubacteria bacterium]|nr:tetratricopeptide repeat protein [Candidatus Rokubacteria bacterium]
MLTALLVVTGCSAARHVTEADRLQAQAAYEQAVAALARREWATALTILRRVTALDPDVPVYRNALGLSLLQLGQPHLALVEFQRAVEIDPGYAEGHLNTGIALAEQGRFAEAVAAYTKAIALPRLTAPDTAHVNLGVALLNLGRLPEAEGSLRFALSLDPQLAAAWYHLGMVLVASERRDEAKDAFRKARELAPGSPFGQAAAERLKALGEGG